MTSSAPAVATDVSLAEVERVVGHWCDGADPALVTGADAVVAVERLASLVRRLTAKQASFAARVEACHSQSRQFASSDDFLARVNGTSRGEAKRAIDTARRLEGCSAARKAFESGSLSLGEAEAISTAVAVDPMAEADLVDRAVKTHDLVELRARADKVKAAARHGEDPTARRSRLRARRRWSEFDDHEMRAMAARFVPEDWARVVPVIDAYAEAQFELARRDGRREPAEAYRADAVLAALAAAGEAVGLGKPTAQPASDTRTAAEPAESSATGTAAEPAESDEIACATAPVEADGSSELEPMWGARPGKVKWEVSVLVDGIALQRGYATATETCEIVGVGPVDVDWVNRILPESVVDVLVHDLVDIRAHATVNRHRKRAIDQALQARDRRCVVSGCRRRRRLQGDHRHDFAHGGETSAANIELLCEAHHAEKTYRGARLERTATHWLWYPPAPKPGELEPPPGSIPWRAPIGEHLTAFDLTDLPPPVELHELNDGDAASVIDGTLPLG